MIVKYNINCNKGVQKEVNIWNLLQWSIGTSMDLINFKTGQWLELVMRAKFYAYGAKLKRILTDRVSFFQILFIPPPLNVPIFTWRQKSLSLSTESFAETLSGSTRLTQSVNVFDNFALCWCLFQALDLQYIAR